MSVKKASLKSRNQTIKLLDQIYLSDKMHVHGAPFKVDLSNFCDAGENKKVWWIF